MAIGDPGNSCRNTTQTLNFLSNKKIDLFYFIYTQINHYLTELQGTIFASCPESKRPVILQNIMKGVFSKPSGKLILGPDFCLLN